MQVSKAFKAAAIVGAFDAIVARDAATGRVPAVFLAALAHVNPDDDKPVIINPEAAILPGIEKAANIAKPAAFVGFVNAIGALQRKPKGATVLLIQAFHHIATAIHDAGKAKVATVNPLPAWADPAAIQQKKEATTAKAKATREANKAEAPTVADSTDEGLASAVTLIVAAANGGHLTAVQRDTLRAALAACAVVADAATAVAVDVTAAYVAAQGRTQAPAPAEAPTLPAEAAEALAEGLDALQAA